MLSPTSYKLHPGKAVVVLIVLGALIGAVLGILYSAISVPPTWRAFISGGTVGGGIVAAISTMNLGVKRGRFTWLRR